MDKKPVKDLTITMVAISKLNQKMSKAVAEFQDQMSELREKEANLHEAVKLSMEKHGVTNFENDILKISYVAPSTRNSIDVARLKEEKPEIAAKYMKQTSVKSSIRIKVKEII